MEYILIAHGAWFQSDGQDVKNKEALYKLPKGLSISIYNAQGTPLSVKDGMALLNKIINGTLPVLQPGYNKVENIDVEFKTFKNNTQSMFISNYQIGGDDSIETGLYQVGNQKPILRLRSDIHFNLQTIADAILSIDKSDKVQLHLLCCQCFK